MTTVDRWRRAPDVAHVDDGVRVVCLDLSDPGRASRPLMLEGLSAAVWRTLTAPESTVDDVKARLGAANSTPIVEACLAALSSHGLVSRDD
jgi:hypothetical protein